jgi:murein DD-endopeptidase MepM/ murein hydrolase activator NlpD
MRTSGKIYAVVLFWLFVQGICFADYTFNKVRPIEYPSEKLTENRYISHNFGEYRSSTYIHDGMDLRIFDWTNHSKIYPIAPGTAHVYPNNGGWGNCVIVEHSTFQTRYAHLSTIYVTEGQSVYTTTELGLSGNTGASKGEHLHFGIGNNGTVRNDLASTNTENPILAGLIQPEYGELIIAPDPKGFKISLLATGIDGTFGGENEVICGNSNYVINISKPGEQLKAVIQANHFIGKKLLSSASYKEPSTPYKVEFEVEKTKGANDFPEVSRVIIFDNMTNITVPKSLCHSLI